MVNMEKINLKKKKIQRVSHTYSCLLWHSSTLPSCSQSYIGIFSSFSLECKRLFPLILTLDMGMKRAWYIDLQEVKQIVPTPTRNKTVLSSASSLRAGSPRPSFPPQQDYTFLWPETHCSSSPDHEKRLSCSSPLQLSSPLGKKSLLIL